MTTADSNPHHLRLVRADEPWDERPSPQRAAAEVAVENRAAALNVGLDAKDPRWVLAVRAYSQLQGTALPFDRRQRLMKTANQLGVRPFDANVIIAVVQDHARRGSKLDGAAGTLALLNRPEPARSDRGVWLRWWVAFLCGAVGTALMIRWIMG